MADQATILITGAAGFTGQHACRWFAAQGYRVFASVRSEAGLPGGSGVSYYPCDLTDKRQVREMIYKLRPEYVLHLGGKNSVPASWDHPLLYVESNLMTTLHVLDGLHAAGLEHTRVLVAGSRLKFGLGNQGAATHPYGLSKALQEAAALAWGELFGLHVMVAEPGNLIGTGPSTGVCSLLARYIAGIERGEELPPFKLTKGDERRDFLDVRDAVNAYEILLTQGIPGKIYPVCSGQEHSLSELAEVYAKLTPATLDLRVSQPALKSPVSASGSASTVVPQSLWDMGWEAAYSWEQSLTDILNDCREEGRARS
ncbi:NAD-dependent epimerase/dehydratase family protein [Paenibacillus senegalimassiliensis]|uniref:NAD-dependent epimerase/dehydratase family protein n=1 Tax=Paenibacillus senegalimassiliensis TaxID=1737426 RepID=UPI00073F2232|nr:NAD-dependent epimerase/dehydratase family protein [Paenibacillus senegalimassiliensis]